jgi:hypothetical protein
MTSRADQPVVFLMAIARTAVPAGVAALFGPKVRAMDMG